MSRTTPVRSVEKNIDMSFDLALAVVDDPSILDTIPDNAVVVPIPDDDPDLIEHNIKLGVQAVRQGENVYFLHVATIDSTS